MEIKFFNTTDEEISNFKKKVVERIDKTHEVIDFALKNNKEDVYILDLLNSLSIWNIIYNDKLFYQSVDAEEDSEFFINKYGFGSIRKLISETFFEIDFITITDFFRNITQEDFIDFFELSDYIEQYIYVNPLDWFNYKVVDKNKPFLRLFKQNVTKILVNKNSLQQYEDFLDKNLFRRVIMELVNNIPKHNFFDKNGQVVELHYIYKEKVDILTSAIQSEKIKEFLRFYKLDYIIKDRVLSGTNYKNLVLFPVKDNKLSKMEKLKQIWKKRS